MAVTASIAVSSKERMTQEALEVRLEPTEVLLGFTQGRHNPGGLGAKVYDFGLTRWRFLLICKEDPLRVYSFYHPFLNRVRFIEGSLYRPHGLYLEIGGETLRLYTPGAWGQRAAAMVQQYNQMQPADAPLRASQVLGLVNDLLELGLPRAAQAILGERVAADPVVEIEPAAAVLDRQINDNLLALRVGTGLLVLLLLILIACQAAGVSQAGLSLMLIAGATVGLARGKQVQRGLALALAILAGLINLVAGVLQSSVDGLILWLPFSAAIALTLTHRPTRGKLVAAVLIFISGAFGSLAAVLGLIPGI